MQMNQVCIFRSDPLSWGLMRNSTGRLLSATVHPVTARSIPHPVVWVCAAEGDGVGEDYLIFLFTLLSQLEMF